MNLEQKERPAYVQFEIRSLENRQKSAEKGHYVGEDVDFAIVTPAGGNLVFEKAALEWLDDLKRIEAGGRNAFYKHYQDLYDAWKSGQEDPVNGTSIRNWPVITPAQLQLCLSLNLRTIEDLAAATEGTQQKLGMGGRSLVQKARDYMDGASNTGKLVEKVNDLSIKLEQAMEAIAAKDKQIDALLTKVSADETIKEAKAEKLKLPGKAA